MGSWIETVLKSLSASTATESFIYIILGVFAFAIIQAARRRHSRFIEHAPNVMTSLGILGTFVGIVTGLLGFDVNQIDTSIGFLLEGMKTAFITSLVGMFFSILFKSIDTLCFAAKRESSDAPEEVSPRHILTALERQAASLENLNRGLSASEEGSVVGQLKMVRTDLSDAALRHRHGREAFEAKLFTEMKTFADLLSKSATEVVIEALRKVIIEFNNNLTEQFGENFKALDSSVKQLVQWQTQYGTQLEQMGQQFDRSVDAIELTQSAIHEIGVRCAEIPGVMETLRSVLEVNQHQLKQLQDHLGAFAQLRDRAIEAVPEIQQQVVGVAEKLSTAAIEMSSILEAKSGIYASHLDRTNAAAREMAMHVTEASERLQDGLSSSAREFESASREMISHLELTSRSIQEQLKICTQEMANAVQRDTGHTLDGVGKQVEAAVAQTKEAVNAQLSALDEAVETELNRVFTRFGTSLARISDAFTGDYEKLIRRLTELSRAAA